MLLVAIPVYSLLIKHLLNDTSPKHVVFTLWNEMINGCVTMMSSDTFKNYPFLFFFLEQQLTLICFCLCMVGVSKFRNS